MAIVFCLCASTADGMPQTKPAAGGPDLQPTNLATEPMVPHESEVVHASARVENRGDVGAEAATIELRDHRPNGDLIAVGSVNLPAALAPGESVVVPLPAFLAAAVGVHTLTVEVTNVVPADADPTNDAASLQMRVDPERVPPPPPPPPSVQPLAVRLFGIEPKEELSGTRSLEELEVLIQSSRAGGGLEEEEYSLLTRSISFGDKTAADALVPRTAMITLHKDEPLADLMNEALKTGHSRFPIIGEDIDNIIGIAHVKDIYTHPPGQRSATKVGEVAQEALIVPESRDLKSLLIDMRREHKQIAVVVDEFGGTAGIITIEDLLEEIVGEIEDEHDPTYVTPAVEERRSGANVVSGLLRPDELKEQTGLELPEGDYDTVAGFLLSLFDRIPRKGDHAGWNGWEFKVVEMDRNRISKILVVAPPGKARAKEEGGES